MPRKNNALSTGGTKGTMSYFAKERFEGSELLLLRGAAKRVGLLGEIKIFLAVNFPSPQRKVPRDDSNFKAASGLPNCLRNPHASASSLDQPTIEPPIHGRFTVCPLIGVQLFLAASRITFMQH